MSPFLIPITALCIPLFGIAYAALQKWLAFKERQLEMMSNDAAERAARYAAQTERLEQRMRVLERIVTDKGVDLADEIERLHDKPLN